MRTDLGAVPVWSVSSLVRDVILTSADTGTCHVTVVRWPVGRHVLRAMLRTTARYFGSVSKGRSITIHSAVEPPALLMVRWDSRNH